MDISDNVNCHVYRGIGAEFCRGDNVWLDSDFFGNILIGDGNGAELEVLYKVVSEDDISVYKCIKVSKCGVDVGV